GGRARKASAGWKRKHEEVARTFDTDARGLARETPAVAIIKAASDSVPKEGGIYLTQLNFERNGAVTIHGNAKTQLAATEMVGALQKSGLFTSVRLGYMGETQSSEAAPAPAPAEKPGEKPGAK